MDWKNQLEKKSNPKTSIKNSNNQSDLATCEQKKTIPRKRIFVQTPFSHTTLKLEQKKLRR